MTYVGETGTVTVVEDEESIPDSNRTTAPMPAKRQLRELPKEEMLKSDETNRYAQWTISVSGILPVAERDVVSSLIMFASLDYLDFENFGGG